MALEVAITAIVDLFLKYADGDGKLSKDEMMKLVQNEMTCPEVQAKLASGEFAKCMKKMDRNRNEELEFPEFARCVMKMCKCAYKKKTGRQQPEDDD